MRVPGGPLDRWTAGPLGRTDRVFVVDLRRRRSSTGPGLGLPSGRGTCEARPSTRGADMGYTTDFIGHIDIEPGLNEAETAYLIVSRGT